MDDRTPPLGRRLRDGAVLAAACAFSAVTVLYAVLYAKVSSVDAVSDVCNSTDCPRGLGRLLLCTVVAWLVAAVLWVVAQRGRPRRSAALWTVAVVVALTALWPAWYGFSWMRGPHMDLSGHQAPEGAGAGKPLGSWAGEPGSGRVVRVREDGLTAYNGGGRRSWGRAAPEGTTVCAMGADTPSGTGVLAYATATGAGPCGTRIAAVDLTSGEERWSKDVPAPTGTGTGTLSAGGSLAVSATAGAVLAHDLREGTERWRAPLPTRPGAIVQEVAAGPYRVLVTVRSDEGRELLALDARTGAVAWRTPLPAEYPRIVSTVPAAVIANDRLLLFDDAGRPRGGGAEPPYVPAATGQRRVVGDVLLVAVPEREKREVLEAYSLVDGRLLWTRAFEDDMWVRALGVGRTGRVEVVTQGAYTHLWHLDLRTGQPAGPSTVLRDLPMGESIAFHGRTFVNLDAGGRLPPVFDVAPASGW
ncbi:PQQ-binding-like beta-propeller repeat protein [Streptomyces sp. NPDC127106]|uniref:outer membrane protein assembly factor BamB family protein n=1 Tax=Streptomyces sp. NPDC127106 TaxID=3345360 RepID=UPI00362ACEFD